MADDLRERLDAVHALAERLVRDATPLRGWDVPDEQKPPRDPFGAPEITALFQLAEQVRAAVPVEIATQIRDAVRELLLALRALIDWYLERIDRGAVPGPEVEDIPIA